MPAVDMGPTRLDEYRAAHRARRRPALIKGWAHFYLILALAASAIALCAAMIEAPTALEWATLPAGFLIANFVEWLAHKYPMHNPTRGLRVMYERHALFHHRFFVEDAMEAGPEDFDAVLFDPPALVFFLIGCAGPIAGLFFTLFSWNAGWLFVALAVSYYALYEVFHTAFHLPAAHWSAKLPGMAARRKHHALHHDPRLMAKYNFNVTFPVFDAIMGTLK